MNVVYIQTHSKEKINAQKDHPLVNRHPLHNQHSFYSALSNSPTPSIIIIITIFSVVCCRNENKTKLNVSIWKRNKQHKTSKRERNGKRTYANLYTTTIKNSTKKKKKKP